MRSLAVNFIRDEKIKSTEAKIKELRPYIEKIITKGIKGDLSGRRLISDKIGKIAAKKVFDKIAPEYKGRDRKSTRLNSCHTDISRMPSSA